MALYVEIVEISAPNEAAPGSVVNVTAKLKNLYSGPVTVKAVGVPEYEGLPPGVYINFPEPQATVSPGDTHTFNGSFTMPDKPVTVRIYSYWYGSDGYFHLDDIKAKQVNVGSLSPVFSDFNISDYAAV